MKPDLVLLIAATWIGFSIGILVMIALTLFRHRDQTLGELIDKLTIINIKIFWCVEILLKCDGPAELLAVAGKRAQALNDQRSKLKNLIDTAYGIDVDRYEVKVTEPQ